jgi:hypothetical protein
VHSHSFYVLLARTSHALVGIAAGSISNESTLQQKRLPVAHHDAIPFPYL